MARAEHLNNKSVFHVLFSKLPPPDTFSVGFCGIILDTARLRDFIARAFFSSGLFILQGYTRQSHIGDVRTGCRHVVVTMSALNTLFFFVYEQCYYGLTLSHQGESYATAEDVEFCDCSASAGAYGAKICFPFSKPRVSTLSGQKVWIKDSKAGK